MNHHVIGELLHRRFQTKDCEICLEGDMRYWISDALHVLSHRIDRSMCRCQVDAYQKGWRVQREQQERRARLMAEEGLPVAAEDFENWLRRRAA